MIDSSTATASSSRSKRWIQQMLDKKKRKGGRFIFPITATGNGHTTADSTNPSSLPSSSSSFDDDADDGCTGSVEPPTFTNIPPITKNHHRRCLLLKRKDSFRTEVTASDELSLSEEEDDDDNDTHNGSKQNIQDISFLSSSISRSSSNISGGSICIDDNEEVEDARDSSLNSSSSNCVRFADELGLPIEQIMHYECDRKQREHSELLVLCICPEKKKFEFLHVGYHHQQQQQQNNNSEDDDENNNDDEDDEAIEVLTSPRISSSKASSSSSTSATVQDLLQDIPSMCTDPMFVNAKFVTLYRSNGIDKFFSQQHQQQQYDDEHSTTAVPLTDCTFRENELVVAAIEYSSESAIFNGVNSLLSNDQILTSLKRGRRSRRSLQFVRSRTRSYRRRVNQQQWRRLKLASSSSLQKTMSRRKDTTKTKEHENNVVDGPTSCCHYITPESKVHIIHGSSSHDLVDAYCHNYDPFHGISEDKRRQLMSASLVVFLGTVIFSTLGL